MKNYLVHIWLPTGIIFGWYVSFWLIWLNHLWFHPVDAGLLTVYLILIYTAIAVLLGFVIQFILYDAQHLFRIKLSAEKNYFYHQIIYVTGLFYLPSRTFFEHLLGNPNGFNKLFYNLFLLSIIASLSWVSIRRYNGLARKFKRIIIYTLYIILAGVTVTVSVSALFQAKAHHQSFASPVSFTASGMNKRQKIMLIGIDAMDWKVLHSLVQQHKLPQVAKLMQSGVSGPLTTLKPSISPLIWTSIATGKLPQKHGIFSFLSLTIPGIRTPIYYHEDTSQHLVQDDYLDSLGYRWLRNFFSRLKIVQTRIVSARDIRAATIWEILNENKYRVGIVGWWPSWPVDTNLNGFMLVEKMTNTFRPQSIHPAFLEDTIRRFERKPEQLTIQDFQRFIMLDTATFEQLRNVAPYAPSLLAPLKRYFIEDDFYFNAGKYLYQKYQPDFFAIYLRGLDGIQHMYWHTYEPEKFPHISPDVLKSDRAKFSKIIEHYYQYMDELLAELLKPTDSHTIVIIVSDHGMEASGTLPFAGTHLHAPPGIIIVSGPQFKKNERIYSATVLDITPTILAAAGLPIADDMDGKVLKEAFISEYLAQFNLSKTIPSYDGLKIKQVSSAQTQYDDEIKERLRSLGYIQ
ncbi:MAG: alkaline phosphatase family protein [bacterium]|nr:alkaline phosphatase family protein [bacterium]